MKKIVCIAAAVTMLAACQQNGNSGFGLNKEEVGAILGGAGGALLGSQVGDGKGQIVAVAVGTLLGSSLGRQIGASLDKADLAYYNQASQKALETVPPGQTLPWRNPESGVSGTITPAQYYQTASGQYCREYTQTIVIGGRTEEGYGVACRQPDGRWKIKE